MDEKDLVKRAKNSFKAKKSRAEILKGFQKRGYKLEYAEKIISKANRPKKILLFSFLSILVLASLITTSYTLVQYKVKPIIQNPFSKFSITGEVTGQGQKVSQGQIDQIEITPTFVSYLLNEVGVWQLHKNPLTFQKPIINSKIGEKTFSSTISKTISTTNGLNENADILIILKKNSVLKIIASSNPKLEVESAVNSKNLKLEVLTSEADLFSKGYLQLYNSLK